MAFSSKGPSAPTGRQLIGKFPAFRSPALRAVRLRRPLLQSGLGISFCPPWQNEIRGNKLPELLCQQMTRPPVAIGALLFFFQLTLALPGKFFIAAASCRSCLANKRRDLLSLSGAFCFSPNLL